MVRLVVEREVGVRGAGVEPVAHRKVFPGGEKATEVAGLAKAVVDSEMVGMD